MALLPLQSKLSPATVPHLATGDNYSNRAVNQDDKENLEQEMIYATNAVETAAIGGRTAICRLICDAILKGAIEPIRKFHRQHKENDETKQIKEAAFTLPRLNEAAQRVATVIANEPPAQMPVLHGLVHETATKTISAMERRIQSLEDQLKAVSGKNKANKVRGDGTKKSPQSILKNKGTPTASKKSAPKKSAPKQSAPKETADDQDASNNNSAHAKGKKKQRKCSNSFDGEKASTSTNWRK